MVPMKPNSTIAATCLLLSALAFRAPGVTYNFVYINFFTQDVVESGPNAVFNYFPFKFADEKAAIAGVYLNYIRNNEPLATVPMTRTGDHFTATVSAPGAAAAVDFYYTLVCAPLTGTGTFSDDTKWFTKVMGIQFDPAPAFPLIVQSSGRLRTAHENEYWSDLFPGADYPNTVYTLTFKDYGDSIEFAVFPCINSSSLELLAFNHSVVDSVCKRAEFALNMGSSTNFLVERHTGPTPKFPQGSPYGAATPWYTATVSAVASGELVDFELLVTDAAGTNTYPSVVYRYYVGSGKLGQEYQHPWANAAGDASISSVTQPAFGFSQHVVNALPGRSQVFLAGKALFDTDWKTSFLRAAASGPDCNGNAGVPLLDKSPFFVSGALGPKYLQESCFECHHEAGPGHPADSAGDSLQAIVFLGVNGPNGISPHPLYGDMLRCKTADGTPPDGKVQVTYTSVGGAFNDGTTYTLRKPVVNLVNLSQGPLDSNTVYSYRVSPFLCGAGLLEAIPDDTIMNHAAQNGRNGDGISGMPAMAVDPVDGTTRIGRFGYKASMPSLKGQIAYLANRCIGLANRYFPVDGSGASGVEIPDSGLTALVSFATLLAPPPRNNWRDSSAIRGKALFEKSGCAACHVPATRTGGGNLFPELDNLEIQPFTDLLLHDMGPDLADKYGQGNALGSQWRTAPLWALGFVSAAGGRESYLHDGRARSILEAILWHGGEAQKAKNAVLGFSAQQRDDIVSFCTYPFADRLPTALPNAVTVPLSRRNFQRQVLLCQPNPVRAMARFALPAASPPASFSMYNMRGQCLLRQSIAAGTDEVLWNSSGYKAGKYLAQFCGQGRTYSRTIVVIR